MCSPVRALDPEARDQPVLEHRDRAAAAFFGGLEHQRDAPVDLAAAGLQNLAAPSSIATCASCPQAWVTPAFCDT